MDGVTEGVFHKILGGGWYAEMKFRWTSDPVPMAGICKEWNNHYLTQLNYYNAKDNINPNSLSL